MSIKGGKDRLPFAPDTRKQSVVTGRIFAEHHEDPVLPVPKVGPTTLPDGTEANTAHPLPPPAALRQRGALPHRRALSSLTEGCDQHIGQVVDKLLLPRLVELTTSSELNILVNVLWFPHSALILYLEQSAPSASPGSLLLSSQTLESVFF